jgi:hypothetical protein
MTKRNQFTASILCFGAIAALLFLVGLHSAKAATVCNIFSGCTGTSTTPGYGKVLIGGKNGEYELIASSTFGGAGSGAVTSVFGRTGIVTAQSGDYSTSLVSEGSNLYFTNGRALASFITNLAATTSVASITTLPNLSLPYSQLTGKPTTLSAFTNDLGFVTSSFATTSADYFLTQRSTSNLSEGSNLYFTNARSDSRFITDLAATTSVKSITTLSSLSLPYSQLTGAPTNLSQFTNDAGYLLSSAFNGLFDNRLSATTSLPNITTLAGLSLPYSQLTGTPAAAAYPFALTGNATSTRTQFNGGLTAYASSTIGNGTQANGLTINGGATTTGTSYFAGNVGIDKLPTSNALDITGTLQVSSTIDTAAYMISGFGYFVGGTNDGIEQTATDNLSFRTAGVQNRFVISSTGNVGIGTTTPYKLLSVGGDVAIGASTAGGTNGNLFLNQLATPAGSFLAVDPSGKVIATTTSPSGGGSSASSTLLSDTNSFSGNDTFTNTITGSVSGNAGTATKLATARAINNVNFDGTAAITVNAASSTALSDTNTFSGVDKFTNASSDFSGTWQTFAPAHFQAALGFTAVPNTRLISTTFPLSGGGDLSADRTLTFGGLSTSTAAVQGNIPYFSGANTFANVATTSVSCTGNATCSAFTVIGSSPVTINVSSGTAASSTLLGDTNTFSGNDAFNNQITGSISGNAGTATKLATARTISITGDLAYTSPSFDGSGNVTAAGTLATVNGNVGTFTYPSVTVNGKGLITAISNGSAPTTYTGSYPIQVSGSVISSLFGTTTGWGIGNNGFLITGPTGIPFVAASSTLNLPNTALANSSLTVNGTSIALGASGTVTANTTNALTFNNAGSGASSGSTFNGSGAVTISYNTIGAQVAGTYVTAVTATAPLFSSGGTTPNLIWAGLATTSQPASSNVLTSNGAAGVYGTATSTLSPSSPLTGSFTQLGSGGTLGIQVATAGQNGYLSSTDFATFNGKQAAGNYITALTGDVTASGPGSVAATIAANHVTLADLAQIGANTVLVNNTNATGNVSAIATSSFFGTGTGGQMLAWNNGVPQWVASTTFSSGLTYANGNVTNTGVTSIVAGTNVTISGATGDVTINASGGGGGAYSFTPSTDGGVSTSATTTALEGAAIGLGLDVPVTSWYGLGGQLFAYASTTNKTTLLGLSIGGGVATTSSTVANTTAIGFQALKLLTSGIQNTAVGSGALGSVTITGSNTAVGVNAFANNTGGNNVGIGNTIGGTGNGGTNTVIGSSAATGLTNGASNVVAGSSAGNGIGSGNSNSFFGTSAGNQTNGSSNSFLGKGAGANSTTGDFNIAIGSNVSPSITNGANQLDIGNVLFGTGMYSAGTVSGNSVANGLIGIGSTSPFAKFSIHSMNGETTNILFAIGSSTQTATTTLFSISNIGAVLQRLGTDVTNAFSILNAAGTTIFNVDTTASRAQLYVGTTTQLDANTVATFTKGATGTSTINFSEVSGAATAHSCFNTKNALGADVSFYINAANTMVVEANLCRP